MPKLRWHEQSNIAASTWLTISKTDMHSWKEGAVGASSLLKTCKKRPRTSWKSTKNVKISYQGGKAENRDSTPD